MRRGSVRRLGELPDNGASETRRHLASPIRTCAGCETGATALVLQRQASISSLSRRPLRCCQGVLQAATWRSATTQQPDSVASGSRACGPVRDRWSAEFSTSPGSHIGHRMGTGVRSYFFCSSLSANRALTRKGGRAVAAKVQLLVALLVCDGSSFLRYRVQRATTQRAGDRESWCD